MTETMAHLRAARSSASSTVPILLIVVASLVASVPLLRHLEDPPRATLLLRNDSAWDVTLYVRGGDTSVTPVRTVSAGRTARVSEVIVPGDTWRFLWRFAGDDIGTTEIDHDALVAPGFELSVPDQVADALRERGAPPSP